MKFVKRGLVALAIAFALFYLVTRPEAAAAAVQTAFGAVWAAGVSIFDFLVALAGG